MNRKPLVSAILAALAGYAGISQSAQVVVCDEHGLGQVFIYPYFSDFCQNVTEPNSQDTTMYFEIF